MFCFDRSEVGINKKFQVTLSCSLTLAHLQPPPNKTTLDTVESTDTQMKWESRPRGETQLNSIKLAETQTL